jgi:catechol 2,3-dioxygenase-like lactoylglutathione lyase family enzyme
MRVGPPPVALDTGHVATEEETMTPARELRFAFTFDDYGEALRLFRDVFGLEVDMTLDHQGGRGVILRVPSATLELFDEEHTRYVDEIEAGSATGARARIAVRIDDVAVAGASVEAVGAVPVAEVVDTPWGDRNRRYRLADGFPVTLFESPGD